MMAAEGSIWQ